MVNNCNRTIRAKGEHGAQRPNSRKHYALRLKEHREEAGSSEPRNLDARSCRAGARTSKIAALLRLVLLRSTMRLVLKVSKTNKQTPKIHYHIRHQC